MSLPSYGSPVMDYLLEVVRNRPVHVTTTVLAEKAGISRGTLWRFTSGKNPCIPYCDLEALHVVLTGKSIPVVISKVDYV